MEKTVKKAKREVILSGVTFIIYGLSVLGSIEFIWFPEWICNAYNIITGISVWLIVILTFIGMCTMSENELRASLSKSQDKSLPLPIRYEINTLTTIAALALVILKIIGISRYSWFAVWTLLFVEIANVPLKIAYAVLKKKLRLSSKQLAIMQFENHFSKKELVREYKELKDALAMEIGEKEWKDKESKREIIKFEKELDKYYANALLL